MPWHVLQVAATDRAGGFLGGRSINECRPETKLEARRWTIATLHIFVRKMLTFAARLCYSQAPTRGDAHIMAREDTLAAAARHCKECEARVARQKARVEHLEQAGHSVLAAEARGVLQLLELALRLAEEALRVERRARGLTD